MNITTVGQLRSLIKGLPDDMTIIPEIGPELQDFILDASEIIRVNVKLGTEELYGSVEIRCDDVERLYLGMDPQVDGGEDGEDEEE